MSAFCFLQRLKRFSAFRIVIAIASFALFFAIPLQRTQALSLVHNTSSDFSGGVFSGVIDGGSGTNPAIQLGPEDLYNDSAITGLYHFENNLNDATVNANSGTNNGATYSTSAKIGNYALSVVNPSNNASIPSSAANNFSLNQDFTVSFWLKNSSGNNNDVSVVEKWSAGSSNPYPFVFRYLLSGNQIQFVRYNGSSVSIAQGGNVGTGVWHLVTGVKSQSQIILYIDGTEVARANDLTSGNTTNAFPVYLGTRGGQFGYTGQIDELAFFSRALSANEVGRLAQLNPERNGVYTSSVIDLSANVTALNSLNWSASGVQTGEGESPLSTNGLIAQWNFNETNGTTAENTSGSCGSACNGTLTNFASTSSQDQSIGTGWTANNRHSGTGALMLDGNNDYLNITDPGNGALDFGSGTFSIEMWVKINSFNNILLSKGANLSLASGSRSGYHLYTNPGGSLKWEISSYDSNNAYTDFITYNSLTTGAWHHIVVMRDTSELAIYVDGVKWNGYYAGSSLGAVTSVSTNADYKFGSYTPNGYYYSGILDSSRVYNRALTVNEIVSNAMTGSLEIQTRTSADGNVWDSWATVDNSGNISSSVNRYFQYRCLFASDNFANSPLLSNVTLDYSVNSGYFVTDLPANINVTLSNNPEIDPTISGLSGLHSIQLLNDNNQKIADIPLDFSQNISLAGLTVASESTRSLVHVAGGIQNLPGASPTTTYSLYVFKGSGTEVRVCPGAASFNEVSPTCAGGYTLSAGQSNGGVTAVVEGSFWKISGLTSTGAMSLLTGVIQDNMTRLAINTMSDHEITFGTNYGVALNQTMTVEFDPSLHRFDFTGLTVGDVMLLDSSNNVYPLLPSATATDWGLNISSDTLTFTAPSSSGNMPGASQVIILIGTNSGGVNQITNPATAGSYRLLITINGTNPEQGEIAVPIVDSDQVTITGYVNTFINFDIDTSVADDDCEYNICLTHENGQAGTNYTVDLGELNSTWVNASNSTAVQHTQGGLGIINSIWFDLTTNAYGGAILYVSSANSGLQGPATNLIASVANDGDDIVPNSGLYGFQLPVAGTGNGTVDRGTDCISGSDYCSLTSTANVVFDTEGAPLDGGRLRMDIGAASSYTNNPGNYTDTLTFRVVATF